MTTLILRNTGNKYEASVSRNPNKIIKLDSGYGSSLNKARKYFGLYEEPHVVIKDGIRMTI